MAIISRDRLATALREADPATVRAFVADLYEARGYAVERDGALLSLSPGDRTVCVVPSGPPPETVDVVVTLDPTVDAGVETVGVAALHERLCYALDGDVARDLLAAHFGVDIHDDPDEGARSREAGEPPVSDRSTVADRLPAGGKARSIAAAVAVSPGRSDWQVATLALAVVVLGAALAVGGVAELPAGDSRSSAVTASTPTPTATPVAATSGTTSTPSANATRDRSMDVHADRAAGSFPPGLGPTGITDAERLVETHTATLENTSYTVTLRYAEYVDGQLTGTYVERIRVESEDRYSVSVSTRGKLETTPRTVVGTDFFVNGTTRYIRDRSAGSYFQSRTTPSRILTQVGQYLRWSLTAERSTVRDRSLESDRTTYRVTTVGDQYPVIDNAEGTVYITESGLVTYGRWTYTQASRNSVRVEFVYETTGLNTTTVSRPGWTDRN